MPGHVGLRGSPPLAVYQHGHVYEWCACGAMTMVSLLERSGYAHRARFGSKFRSAAFQPLRLYLRRFTRCRSLHNLKNCQVVDLRCTLNGGVRDMAGRDTT
jgi:hypothetical protein